MCAIRCQGQVCHLIIKAGRSGTASQQSRAVGKYPLPPPVFKMMLNKLHMGVALCEEPLSGPWKFFIASHCWRLIEFNKEKAGAVNQETSLFDTAGVRLQPEWVKCVLQELAATGWLCFCFPAACIKGLLLSESAPARLSAAKSTTPSGLCWSVSVSAQPRGRLCNTFPGQWGLKPSPAFAVQLWTVKSNPWQLAHSCGKAPQQGQAVIIYIYFFFSIDECPLTWHFVNFIPLLAAW